MFWNGDASRGRPTTAQQPALTPDLARPISVRAVAYGRGGSGPAVPGDPSSRFRESSAELTQSQGQGFRMQTSMVLPPRPTAPNTSAVYAATSSLNEYSYAPDAATRASAGGPDPSHGSFPAAGNHTLAFSQTPHHQQPQQRQLADFASLAAKGINDMSYNELYDHASRLQDEAQQARRYVATAYATRDQYREEVARLRRDLHSQYMQSQSAERERERYSNTIHQLQEDVETLRRELDASEGRANALRNRLAVTNRGPQLGSGSSTGSASGDGAAAANAAAIAAYYKSQLAATEAELAAVRGEKEGLQADLARSRQLTHNSTDSGNGDNAAGHTAVDRDTEAIIEALQREVNALAGSNEALHSELEGVKAAHAEDVAALNRQCTRGEEEVAKLKAANEGLRTELDTICESYSTLAPVTREYYQQLEREHAALKERLAGTEAKMLGEATSCTATTAGDAEAAAAAEMADLRERVLTLRAELADALKQLTSARTLVDAFEKETDLSGSANQLRQQVIDELQQRLADARAGQASAEAALAGVTEELTTAREELATRRTASVGDNGNDGSPTRGDGADSDENPDHSAVDESLTELRDELDKRTRELAELRAALESTSAHALSVSQDAAAGMERLREDLASRERDLVTMTQELTALRGAAADAGRRLESGTAELEEQLLKAGEENAALQAALDALAEEYADAQSTAEERQATIVELAEMLHELERRQQEQEAERSCKASAPVDHEEAVCQAALATAASASAEVAAATAETGVKRQAAELIDAQAQVAAATGVVEKLADTLAEVQERARTLTDESAPMHREVMELHRQVGQADESRTSASARAADTDELRAQQRLFEQQITTLTDRLALAEAAAAQLLEERGEHENALAALREEFSEAAKTATTAARAESEEERAAMQVAVNELADALVDARTRVAQLESEADGLRLAQAHLGSTEELRSQLDAFRQRGAALEERATVAEQALEAVVGERDQQADVLARALNDLTAAGGALETQKSVAKAEAEARVHAEAQLAVTQSALDKLTDDLETVVGQHALSLQTLEAALAAAEEESLAHKRERDAEVAARAKAEADLAALHTAMDTVADALEEGRAHSEALQSALNASEAEAKAATDKLARLVSDLDIVSASLNVNQQRLEESAGVSAQLEPLRRQNADLMGKLASAEAALATLADQHSSQGDCLSSLRAELDAQRNAVKAESEARVRAEADLAAAQAALDKLAEECAAEATKRAEAEKTCTAFQGQLAEVQREWDTQTRCTLHLEETLRAAEGANGAAAKSVDELATRLDATAAQLAVTTTERDVLCAQLAEERHATATATQAVDRLADDLGFSVEQASALSVLEKSLDSACETLVRMTSERDELKERARTQADRVAELERMNEAQAGHAESLRQSLHNVKDAMAALAHDLDMARTEAAAATRATHALAERLAASQEEAQLHRQEGDEHAKAAASAQAAVTALAEQLAEAHGEAADREVLQEQLTETQARAAQLESQCVQLEDKLAQLTESGIRSIAMLQTSHDELVSSSQERDSLRATIAEVQQALATAQAENTELSERLDAALMQNEQTAIMYNERNDEIAATEARAAFFKHRMMDRDHDLEVASAHLLDVTKAFQRALLGILHEPTDPLGASSVTGKGSSSSRGTESDDMAPLQSALNWMAKVLRESVADDDLAASRAAAENDADGELAMRNSDTRSSTAHSDDSRVSVRPSLRERCAAEEAANERRVAAICSALGRLRGDRLAASAHKFNLQASLTSSAERCAALEDALVRLSEEKLTEEERADNLYDALTIVQRAVSRTQAEFEQQMRERTESATAEMIVAQRAAERADGARRRAEERLALAEADLEAAQAELKKLQDRNRDLGTTVDRLSRMLPDSHRTTGGDNNDGNRGHSLRDQPGAGSGGDGGDRFHTHVDQAEQAQMLHVATMNVELMQARRRVRELEANDATMRSAYTIIEEQLETLRAQAEHTDTLRAEVEELRAELADLQSRYEALLETSDMSEGGAALELRTLRQQRLLLEGELAEWKARYRDLSLVRDLPKVEAQQRENALSERLRGLTCELDAAHAQYARPSAVSPVTSGGMDAVKARLAHLEAANEEKERRIEQLAADKLRDEARVEALEDAVAAKATALSEAERLLAQYVKQVDSLTSNARAMQQSARTGGTLSSLRLTPLARDSNSGGQNRGISIGEEGTTRSETLSDQFPMPRLPVPTTETARQGKKDSSRGGDANLDASDFTPTRSSRNRSRSRSSPRVSTADGKHDPRASVALERSSRKRQAASLSRATPGKRQKAQNDL